MIARIQFLRREKPKINLEIARSRFLCTMGSFFPTGRCVETEITSTFFSLPRRIVKCPSKQTAESLRRPEWIYMYFSVSPAAFPSFPTQEKPGLCNDQQHWSQEFTVLGRSRDVHNASTLSFVRSLFDAFCGQPPILRSGGEYLLTLLGASRMAKIQ